MIKRDAVRTLVESWLAEQTMQSCLNCAKYQEAANFCVKYKTSPPPKIIVFSCGESWEGDIPF